ncbi:hypothetical protein DFJ74DRAFT_707091 [Hyaloraphidium curvatum]|nr:hypothetical protein DFJ74DRAFT_707091 [Hyaloraphidium curvatum]
MSRLPRLLAVSWTRPRLFSLPLPLSPVAPSRAHAAAFSTAPGGPANFPPSDADVIRALFGSTPPARDVIEDCVRGVESDPERLRWACVLELKELAAQYALRLSAERAAEDARAAARIQRDDLIEKYEAREAKTVLEHEKMVTLLSRKVAVLSNRALFERIVWGVSSKAGVAQHSSMTQRYRRSVLPMLIASKGEGHALTELGTGLLATLETPDTAARCARSVASELATLYRRMSDVVHLDVEADEQAGIYVRGDVPERPALGVVVRLGFALGILEPEEVIHYADSSGTVLKTLTGPGLGASELQRLGLVVGRGEG